MSPRCVVDFLDKCLIRVGIIGIGRVEILQQKLGIGPGRCFLIPFGDSHQLANFVVNIIGSLPLPFLGGGVCRFGLFLGKLLVLPCLDPIIWINGFTLGFFYNHFPIAMIIEPV